jgi:hypothetical protein
MGEKKKPLAFGCKNKSILNIEPRFQVLKGKERCCLITLKVQHE